MEAIPVKEMKKWAKDTLPPMAWQRVTFRILPQLNKLNVFLHFFEDDNYLLKEEVFKTLDNTFLEIFGKQFTDAPTEIIAPITKEQPVYVPLVEKSKVILPIDEPVIEKVKEILPIDEPIIGKVEEILPIVEPIIEKVKEILPIDEPIVEKIQEILPIDEPIVEKIQEIELPKEEKKEPEKPEEKPFVSFFSLEQLKRIFGKK